MTIRKMLLLFALFFSLHAFSQSDEELKDSAGYYQRELFKLRQRVYDSLRVTEEYQRLEEGIKRHRSNSSTGFAGFVLGGGLIRSDYSAFNEQIAKSGFPAMDPMAGKFIAGVTFKEDRVIVDYYFLSISDGSDVKKGDDEISASVNHLLYMDMGYALINTRRFAFYPYYGLSLRIAQLSYKTPVEFNPASTDISNIIQNNRRVETSSFRAGYQAGLGMDIVLFENKKRSTNTAIFIKGGVARPIGKDRYKEHGVVVNKDIRHGILDLTFGIKFGNMQ
jgi:hypothetical protein